MAGWLTDSDYPLRLSCPRVLDALRCGPMPQEKIINIISRIMSRYGDCKVYVGDLGNNASKPELEDAFSYYGPLRNVWVARNPPGFAFVEFEDPRDAEDAIRGLDGRTICGRRARVEMSNGGRGYGGRGPPPRSRLPPRPYDDRCYDCGDRGHYARDCTRRYHWPVRRERTRQCLHFLLSALRSFLPAACTPIELIASSVKVPSSHALPLATLWIPFPQSQPLSLPF
ncbi:hypothetical protein SFRURICE_021364 [Spodoptera frugiperda]|nr:hypothetical protein SFRURICE_021364 [Spodoptera frugiperda]